MFTGIFREGWCVPLHGIFELPYPFVKYPQIHALMK